MNLSDRRKARIRRRLAEALPILVLYCRSKTPLEIKQIARRLGRSRRWVGDRIRGIIGAL